MSLTASDSGGGDFTPPPEGTHIARCVRLIDLGMQPGSPEFPEAKRKVLMGWEIPDEPITIDGEERPALVMSRYTMSLHKKAKLRADLESWRGRSFTDAELKGFSLKNVLDQPCMITIVHTPDGRYANVRSIAKMPKGVPCPARVSDLVQYEIEDGQNDVYHALSEKMRATIDIGAGRTAPTQPAAPARHAPAAPTAPAYDDTQRKGGQLRHAVANAPRYDAPPPAFDDEESIPF